jgi:prepilin-type N-terminal cleavage/methylation domain-containing protein
MINKNKDKKGFTLIELVISMAIMGMVMVTIYSLFFSNYKTMNIVNSGIELQSQGEQAMNYLFNSAISAESINTIKDEKGEDITEFNSTNSKKISEISFKTLKYDKTNNTVVSGYIEKIILQLDSSNVISPTEGLYKMYRVEKDLNGNDKNIFLSSFISSIEVRPFPENSSQLIKVEDIKGLEFIITLKKWKSGKTGRVDDLMTKTISNNIKFRN